MTVKAGGLKRLRAPVATLLLVLGCSAAAVALTDRDLGAARQRTEQHERQVREARLRLQKSGEEKAIILRYLPEYQALQKQGFIGAEQRIDWLDGLRAANARASLFGIEYQIGAQQPYANVHALGANTLPFQQSLMKISFKLLHEEDLLRFFKILEDQDAGTYALNECAIERIAGSPGGVQPNLRAECELAWITLNAAAVKP